MKTPTERVVVTVGMQFVNVRVGGEVIESALEATLHVRRQRLVASESAQEQRREEAEIGFRASPKAN